MDRGSDPRRNSDYRSRESYRSNSYSSDRDSTYSSSHYSSRNYGSSGSSQSVNYHSREPPLPPSPSSRYNDRDDTSYSAAFRGQVPYITSRDTRPPLPPNPPPPPYDRRPSYRAPPPHHHPYSRGANHEQRGFNNYHHNSPPYNHNRGASGSAYHHQNHHNYQPRPPPSFQNPHFGPPPHVHGHHRPPSSFFPSAKSLSPLIVAPELEEKLVRYRQESIRLRAAEEKFNESLKKAKSEVTKAEWIVDKEIHKTQVASQQVERFGPVEIPDPPVADGLPMLL